LIEAPPILNVLTVCHSPVMLNALYREYADAYVRRRSLALRRRI
jgi:hypothetical protein